MGECENASGNEQGNEEGECERWMDECEVRGE